MLWKREEKYFALLVIWRKGTSGGVMVSKLDLQTYTSEFESHWVPHSFGLVLNRSKDLRKLLLVIWREKNHSKLSQSRYNPLNDNDFLLRKKKLKNDCISSNMVK